MEAALLRDLARLIPSEDGATAIEYALIGTLVGVAIIVALQNFASMTNVLYTLIEGVTVYL